MNKQKQIAKGVELIIGAFEPKPFREDLQGTPDRVARAYIEMLDGYGCDVDGLFKAHSNAGKDQLVMVKDITFTSWCPHHLMPWRGTAHVAYLPRNKVLGLSKIGRLVLAYAHRLILQEELTKSVAYTLMKKLKPLGVAVIVTGEHSCMRCRGVKLDSSKAVCSEMLGAFRQNPALRQELLSLLGGVK